MAITRPALPPGSSRTGPVPGAGRYTPVAHPGSAGTLERRSHPPGAPGLGRRDGRPSSTPGLVRGASRRGVGRAAQVDARASVLAEQLVRGRTFRVLEQSPPRRGPARSQPHPRGLGSPNASRRPGACARRATEFARSRNGSASRSRPSTTICAPAPARNAAGRSRVRALSVASRAPRLSRRSSVPGPVRRSARRFASGRPRTDGRRAITSGRRRGHSQGCGRPRVRAGQARPSCATSTPMTATPGTPRSSTRAPRSASSAGAMTRPGPRSPNSGHGPAARPCPPTCAPRAGAARRRERCDAATEASRRPGPSSAPSPARPKERDGHNRHDQPAAAGRRRMD